MIENYFENDNRIKLVNKSGVTFLQYSNLLKYSDHLVHCFSTRLGGVSNGSLSSLNLSFNRGDSRENVLENFKRISDALEINYENIVCSNQIHDDKILIVDESHRGNGIIKENLEMLGFDGLITNKKDIVLLTFYADCVPILLYDPVCNVIASVHSGWMGTLKEIGGKAVEKMVREFGINPQNIEAVIGPSIGKCCFEVSEDVFCAFNDKFNLDPTLFNKISQEKWTIDLQSIIFKTLTSLSLLSRNIIVSNICTKCNTHYFFSYRGDKSSTGSLAAFFMLKHDFKNDF